MVAFDLSHLSAEESKKQALLPLEERRLIIQRTRWYTYPRADAIIAHMDWLFAHARTDRMPNMHVIAESMSGKSRILKRFYEELHPSTFDPTADTDVRPVVYVELQSKPTPKDILEEILVALHAPFGAQASPAKLMASIAHLFDVLSVRMLILDEIQHIMRGSPAKQREVRDQIKVLGNRLKVPIVAAGILESSGAFSSDAQLSTRFKPMHLPRWDIENSEDVEQLGAILLEWEAKCPLRKPSCLSTSEEAFISIFESTGGLLGHIVDYLKKASEFALDSGTECITPKLLKNLPWEVPKEAKKGYLPSMS